ncbi:MAG: DUF4442 domain-containing protein [Brachymonas sp.]|nr:DUF4442 domain-containing protein [Brachymonas sp.]
MPSTQPNRLQRRLAQVERLPAAIRTWARTKALGRAVPLTGTTSLRYEVMTPEQVVITVANRPHVRNHIGGVHAMASVLAAETATGMLMGLSVRDDCVNVVKEVRSQFVKRGQGAMRAVAVLSEEQRQQAGQVLRRKCLILAKGAEKRGQDGEPYRAMAIEYTRMITP